MGSFDAFKKKADAPQKTLICARCKKEITDEESKWIGNHRFCKDCAAPLKVATNKVPVKSKENAYKSKKDKPQWLKVAPQKTFICARCKKEIPDEESKWIGNHRFCADCAAPPKKAAMESHLESEARDAEYQAYMDFARGSLTPEQAYSNRGFVKDKDGKWVYGKLITKDTFICSKCGKELAKKYMHANHVCVDCATLPVNKTPQKQKGQSVYNKNKSLCLCYYKKDEYEWYQVELQFSANNEILIVDTYYWPAHRGASNGGQSTTKLDADYFAKNTIDDFIVFLKNNYKLAKDFNQDFSALKNRDDIKALFENSNKTVQPQIIFADERPLGLYRDKKYLHKLFDVYFNAEEQREKFVCYDTITGIPYLIDSQTKYEGHAIISSWYGTKLTYEQVALFAQNYAQTSPLSDISSDNWKEFFDIDNTTQHNPSTYTDSITRESNTAFLSYSGYLGSIVPIKLDWRDIEGAPRFNFAGAPHFDEISIGLIKQGKYINHLFITIINDGYPSGNGGGTAEVLPENHHSYEGVKRYIEGRGFSVYQPIAEETYNKNINELIV